MSAKNSRAPASEPLWTRRRLLVAAAAWSVAPWWLRGGARAAASSAPPGSELPAALEQALETSPFVYVSPLRPDGSESTCHGEVWFAWLDGAVLVTTARTTWKARAVARGLARARLWVGDFGSWKRAFGRNERFRSGPNFEAQVQVEKDPALVERLIEVYARKYPREIARWRDRIRQGHERGERVLLRYRPIASSAVIPPGAGAP